VEAGLRAALRDPNALTVVKGCDIEAPIAGGIEAAVAAARSADIILLAVGESQNMSGEAQSRVEIIVPEPQQALAQALAATGKPIVVLLHHGRALALHGAIRDAEAILATWFLGSQTGHAIADIVFGDVSPSARLPVSFPQESGQEPFFYNQRRTGRPQVSEDASYKARYREVPHEALYPFGHGLTYTSFAYGTVELSSQTLGWDGSITVSVAITNTGARAGQEVAQLYIHDRAASITQPVRVLKGFEKITLAVGETRTVSFTISREDLKFHGPDLAFEAEPGEFDVWIAPSATAGEPRRFRLAASE
jgi:beta-glucosidase